ncbi:abortive infection protein [Serratia ureilytica]|uniref:abortive infection protein n=1 Tax=Serratia ureilytica TaxID=300181 RepID=UPI00249ADDD4|nr:abortive infection protein [Serratia ureilytica]MDI3197825.1 abortive infection protein [Serratia ureilytica]
MPDGTFVVELVGASDTDATPNPCYQKPGCLLRYFTIDESWLPGGQQGYGTWDPSWAGNNDDAAYRTLGAWVKHYRDQGILYRAGRDNLPAESVNEGPCVVVAAGNPQMVVNTIVSNCARGIVQAPTCDLVPTMINLTTEMTNWGRNRTDTVPDTPIQLTCTQTTDAQIETNTDEKIPLGGSSEFYAELDWGAGYGKPGKYKVTANKPSTIRVRASIKGYEKVEPGKYSGTAIVNVSYL